ncbi:MAG: tetratricopeptide repeat protein, partial [Chthoniobacteraceae bacterium]
MKISPPIFVSAVALFMSLVEATRGQGAEAATAEDLLNQAKRDYAAAKWESAAAGFDRFISDYGAREETRAIVSRLRFPLARCHLHLKKFPEALAAIEQALKVEPPPPAAETQEFTFWKGVCQMQGGDFAEARKTLERFVGMFPDRAWRQPFQVAQFPAARNIPEALLLAGNALLLEKKFPEAAEFLGRVQQQLAGQNRGRAAALQLYALMQAGDDEKSFALIKREFPRLEEMIQIATFQVLTLELGSRFLERGEYRNAIACFVRIWPAARLIELQQKRLDGLQSRLAALEANPRSDAYARHMLAQLIVKVQRETEHFAAIENFDSAVRLRLAHAFHSMNRYRETALVLEGMLRELPANSIVESASISLVQCWGQIERWPKVVEAADEFAKKFPRSKSLPLARYFRGIALQKDGRFESAIDGFRQLAADFPTSEYAPRALFMEGFTQLLAEHPPEAIRSFERFGTEQSTHEFADAAAYWEGMAYSLDHQFKRCREVMDDYLTRFPQGRHRGLAVFRKAYAIHSLRDYGRSIEELRAYLRNYPGHESKSEALILLGDALMAEGEIEEGIAALQRIPPADVRFYEEGWFKIGQALKLMERPDELRVHMQRFADENPRSSRLGEAVYWIGWVYRQQNDSEKARAVYWETINRHGNDPGSKSIDDLFPALAKLYRGEDERRQYQTRLKDLAAEAMQNQHATLTMRANWAQARELRRSDAAQSRRLMIEAARNARIESTNPLLLADFARALTDAGEEEQARQMWRNLLKWNPRAPQKDQALAALGKMELAQGNEKAALDYFERFEDETLGSPLRGEILLARAELLRARGEEETARLSLDKILEDKATPGQQRGSGVVPARCEATSRR